MNHTQFKSPELNDAASVAANQLQPPTTSTGLQQIEHDLLSFLAQKDHTLLKHFNEGKTHARISISADELMSSIMDEFRRHIFKRCADNDTTCNFNAPLVNKIFDIIKMNLEVLRALNIPYKRNELVASIQGNLLKHIV